MPTKADLQAKCALLEAEIADLQRQLLRMERELSGQLLPEEIEPQDMPTVLRAQMKRHKVPWEAFWCYEHDRWLDELSSSFPHDIYGTCPTCRGGYAEKSD